jgi:hypothetical protein
LMQRYVPCRLSACGNGKKRKRGASGGIVENEFIHSIVDQQAYFFCSCKERNTNLTQKAAS